MIRALVLVAMLCGSAQAQDGLHSSRPQGHYGVGHDQHHAHYLGLVNGAGGSCCNGTDGRPTSARFVDGNWEAQVNGEWRQINPNVVLTPQVFERQGRERWDAQAHIFTSKTGGKQWPPTVYCFIPPASGG